MKQSNMHDAKSLPASDPPSLAERIRHEMDSFTPSEKRAAHLLLSHYPFAGLDTVAEFAARAGISAPSALRFVTRLGFNGFPDFQRHLREDNKDCLTPDLRETYLYEKEKRARGQYTGCERSRGRPSS